MIRLSCLFLLLLFPLSRAHALLPGIGHGIGTPLNSSTDAYRLGDEWGKAPVTAGNLANATPAFRRAALATANVGGATGFYLGKFAGKHVMATNNHVLPGNYCRTTSARFPLLGVSGSCEELLGTWPEIDLALFTIRVSAADEAKLIPVAASFRVHDHVRAGQRLLTIGFGSAGNPRRAPVANQDSDCYAFSQNGEYRLMADPDQLSPGAHRVWSFALGCDGSHGDSGSAIVDRDTGNVLGILWTGRIPKPAEAQSSAALTRAFQEKSEKIWELLTYAVPAKKIGEHLRRLTEGSLPQETRAIFLEMLKR